jgi:ABC-type transporter Mla subunit MlaD
MKSSALYLRVGLLVLAGLLLATLFVVFLLGQRSSGPMVTLETYSRESVQGLDVGAPVRYRGVPIGRVMEIGLASAEYRRPERVAYTEAFQLVVIRFAVDPARIGEVPTAQEAIAIGLRARISSQGITGVNYIELDFVNPDRFPMVSVPWTPRFPFVPAIPSTVAQVRGAAETLVERLTQIPIEQVASDIAALIGGLSRQANDGDLATALREVAQIAAHLRAMMDSGALEALLAEAREAAAGARGVTNAPELREAITSVAAAANELRRTTQRLPATIDGMERTLRTARHTTTDIQSELVPILADLRATTASLRATAEAMRASPSQSIFGAPPPPPPPERRR